MKVSVVFMLKGLAPAGGGGALSQGGVGPQLHVAIAINHVRHCHNTSNGTKLKQPVDVMEMSRLQSGRNLVLK